jgi:hypothetical protein
MPNADVAPEVIARLREKNPLIILRYLLEGREWEHDDKIYVLSDDYEICVVAHVLDESKGISWDNFREGERRYLRTDMSLQYFLKMAMDVDIDETAIMAANMALTDIGRQKARKV